MAVLSLTLVNNVSYAIKITCKKLWLKQHSSMELNLFPSKKML